MAPIDDLEIKPNPDFNRLRKVLLREGEPDRVPFYELFFDKPMKDHLLGKECAFPILLPFPKAEEMILNDIELNHRLGFDFVCLLPLFLFGDSFQTAEDNAPLKSAIRFWLKEDKGAELSDRAAFDNHNWPDPEAVDFNLVEFAIDNLPEGMQAIGQLPGIIETVTWLMGYENLGIALIEDPELIELLFEKVGSSVLRFAERFIERDGVGALVHGDDMGHKTGLLINPKLMRDFGFPWHKKIADTCHEKDIPYIMHACGQVDEIMGDYIDFIGIDAKHSFEDIIEPVEDVYSKWGDKVALLGGVDVDLLSRGSVEDVQKRTREVLKKCAPGGGYALGTGNSVTNYIKPENFLAMLQEGWKSGAYPISI